MSLDHRDGRAIIFSYTSMIKIRSIVGEHEVNKQGFIFKGIRWWPVINLVTLIHGYSYLISHELVASYRKVRSSRNPGQFKCVLEKPDITHPSRNS